MKYTISKTYEFNNNSESDKIKLVNDLAKIRERCESPAQFYSKLMSYFKNRPMVLKEMEKPVRVLVGELTGLSILRVIGQEDSNLLDIIVRHPEIVIKFGREINRMEKDNNLDTIDLRLAIGGDGKIFVGDEVDKLEKMLKESGRYNKVAGGSNSMYESLLDDDIPNVSLTDIDLHLEGEA